MLDGFAKQQLLRESSSKGQFLSFVDHFHIKSSSLRWDNLLCILLLQPGEILEIFNDAALGFVGGIGLSEKTETRWTRNKRISLVI